ncbi:MAG: hypothetical protein H6673_09835 [Anaerolineales bacterium]|nr:hypothetical protein [Anaerolineales bacterium]
MPKINNRSRVASQLQLGIQAIAAHNQTSQNATLEKLSVAVSREPSTLGSWMYATKIPGNIDDGAFFAVVWFVLATHNISFKWFEELLSGTNVLNTRPVTPDVLLACLQKARVNEKSLSEGDIRHVLDFYFDGNKLDLTSTVEAPRLHTLVPLEPVTQQYIESAKEILVEGISLFRFIPAFYPNFERALTAGASMRVLMVDPNSPAMNYVAYRSTSHIPIETQRQRVISTLDLLQHLANETQTGGLELRVMDYMPPYGITIYHHATDPAKSSCSVRLFTFRTPTPEAPTITPDPIDHEAWFNYFVEQFEKMWEIGYSWNP